MSNSVKIPREFEKYALPSSADFMGKGRQINTFHFYFQELRRHQGLSVRLLSGSIVYTDHAWVYPLHRHSHYELIFPQEGDYHCKLNGQEVSLRPGDALLIQPGDNHQDHFLGVQKYFAFEFGLQRLETGLLFPHFLRRGSTAQEHVFSIQNPEDVRSLLDIFQRELQRHPGGFFPIMDGLFQTLFWLIFLQMGRQTQLDEVHGLRGEEEIQKQRLLECFQANCTKHMEVGDLCRALGMSASSLNRVCRRFFGMSPMRAFLQLKMEIVKSDLVDNPRVLLKDKAVQMGFADQFHFSKCFRQYVGVSPKKYLAQVSLQKEGR
ncbi:MAG: helix-turn-helix domain-containing protein [Oligosphaeraceae bacterium]